ncbi:hypothetical protein PHMEG_00010501 [Phytophthora megakarya]|uniref:Uncharacterized protein n=1 Tax=Phytophthora megakarya TaxID=4795 RepID=A0A225WFK0_9STRA|nr:hypothetical protein PHMEG_00010501 [Phytophthora megakarya]
MFYTITIPTFKVDIRGSAVVTIGSGIILTGENCTAVYRDMSVNHRYVSLPRSHKGNTELLIFEDLFYRYVIVKASGSRAALAVAESY